MENKRQRSGSILIFGLLFLLFACSKEKSSGENSEVNSALFQTYTHNGLTLRHPRYWTFAYDDSPSLYADRGVSFNVSEISGVSVFIYKDDTMNLTRVADHYERTLNLKSDEYTKNYQRQLVEINGSKGEKLLWSDTMFGTTKTEVIVLLVAGAPTPTFAVFHLIDEDIEKESSNIIHFLNSILFQREEPLADSKDFVSYTKDGLNLSHPGHWELAHDGYLTPSSGRGVAFDTSEHSQVMVLIYDAEPAVIKDLVDQYIRELKLESENIENYRQKSVELGGFQGVQLSWWDGPVTAEITIVEISNEQVPIFVVFQLMNDDIINESHYFIPFLKSAQFIKAADDEA